MIGEIQLNNSSLSTLQKCGERYRRQYVDCEESPPTQRMARGSATHWVAKEGHKRQMAEAGRWPSIARAPRMENLPGTMQAQIEAEDLAATAFDREVADGVTLTREEQGEGRARVLGRAKDFVVAASGFYTSTIAPSVDPTGVEHKVLVRPADVSELVIHGTMDVVDRGTVIRDLKTSERSPRKDAANESQQLDIYATLHLAETQELPTDLVLDWVVRTPARFDLKHVEQHTSRGVDDVEATLARLNVAVNAVRSGVFLPTDPSNWWCSAKWCPFYASCRYVTGRRQRDDD